MPPVVIINSVDFDATGDILFEEELNRRQRIYQAELGQTASYGFSQQVYTAEQLQLVQTHVQQLCDYVEISKQQLLCSLLNTSESQLESKPAQTPLFEMYVGSARQSHAMDEYNRDNNGNGLCFPLYKTFCKERDWVFRTRLLADRHLEQRHGVPLGRYSNTSFSDKNVCLDSQSTFLHDLMNEMGFSPQNPMDRYAPLSDFLRDLKIELLYDQLQDVARNYSAQRGQIYFRFYDDRVDILEALQCVLGDANIDLVLSFRDWFESRREEFVRHRNWPSDPESSDSMSRLHDNIELLTCINDQWNQGNGCLPVPDNVAVTLFRVDHSQAGARPENIVQQYGRHKYSAADIRARALEIKRTREEREKDERELDALFADLNEGSPQVDIPYANAPKVSAFCGGCFGFFPSIKWPSMPSFRRLSDIELEKKREELPTRLVP